MTEENWTDHVQVSTDFPLPPSRGPLLGDDFKILGTSSPGYRSLTVTVLRFLITCRKMVHAGKSKEENVQFDSCCAF